MGDEPLVRGIYVSSTNQLLDFHLGRFVDAWHFTVHHELPVSKSSPVESDPVFEGRVAFSGYWVNSFSCLLVKDSNGAGEPKNEIFRFLS